LSGGPPANAHDILGWWVLPIGLLVGSGLLYLTFRFGTWTMRKLRRPRSWRFAWTQVVIEPLQAH
jgi:hypothetical protein